MVAGAPTAGWSVRVWGRTRKSPKSHDFGYGRTGNYCHSSLNNARFRQNSVVHLGLLFDFTVGLLGNG